MSKPLVSILMSVRNGADTITGTIESVLAQTYTNWELVIRDNCSTDNTIEIIESFNDKRIHVIRNEFNMGSLFNFICLILTANGDFIKTIDDDSYLYPKCLEKQIEILESRPDIAFATCDTEYRTPTGKTIKAKLPFKNDTAARDEYIKFTLLTARGSVQEGNQTLYRTKLYKDAWKKLLAEGLEQGYINIYAPYFYLPSLMLLHGNLYIIHETLSAGMIESNSYSLKFNQAKLLVAWIKLLRQDAYKISPFLYIWARIMIIIRATARRLAFKFLGRGHSR
jgi:glycosyltransferase involved in cell wall biosynthesis